MDGTDERPAPWTNDERPRAAGEPGGPVMGEHGGPPDYHPEPGVPAFSKGGHGAGDAPPGALTTGSHEPTEEERNRRADAQPPRR